jgi:hypothetical protein
MSRSRSSGSGRSTKREGRAWSGDVAAEQYRRAVGLMDELGEGHYCDCCRARLVKAIRRLDPDRPAPALPRDPR